MNTICYDTQFHSEVSEYINRYRLDTDITLPYECQFCGPIYTKYKQNKRAIDSLIEEYKIILTGLSEVEILQIILCYSNEKFSEATRTMSNISLQNHADILKAQRFNDILLQYELLNYCSMPLGQKRRNIYRYFSEFFKMNLSDVNRLLYDLLQRGDILLYKNFVELNVKQLEEKFRYLLETYYIPDEWLKDIFGLSENSIDYFNEHFNRGFVSIERMIRDFSLSVHLKRLFTAYIADKVCDICGERVISTKVDIIKGLLEGYDDEEMDMVGLYVDYEIVTESAPNSDELWFETLNDFEEFVEKLPFVLWTSDHYFRYCDLTVADINSIISKIDFEKYNDSEISADLLYRDSREWLESFGIVEFFEFYYFLIINKERIKKFEVNFKDYLILSIGKVDIDKQIRFILEKHKKINFLLFALFYNHIYGIDIEKHSMYKTEIDKYLIDDTLYINKEEILAEAQSKVINKSQNKDVLTGDEIDKLKELLKEPIYTFKQVKILFQSVVGGNLGYKVTFGNLRLLGYERVGNIVHRKEFKSIEEATEAYLERFEILKLSQLDEDFVQHERIKSVLEAVQDKFKFVGFGPGSFISLKKLSSVGITKKNIYDYIDLVEAFTEGKYFTITWLRNKNFESVFDSLGFDNYFYDSILKYSWRFEYNSIGKALVFSREAESVTLAGLIEEIVNPLQIIDIYDLIEILHHDFGVEVAEKQIIMAIKKKQNTELYYCDIKEKIYKDYDIYLDNIE